MMLFPLLPKAILRNGTVKNGYMILTQKKQRRLRRRYSKKKAFLLWQLQKSHLYRMQLIWILQLKRKWNFYWRGKNAVSCLIE
nr:MAG TPA: hypothetical protein [Caudoviricetes sp.]